MEIKIFYAVISFNIFSAQKNILYSSIQYRRVAEYFKAHDIDKNMNNWGDVSS